MPSVLVKIAFFFAIYIFFVSCSAKAESEINDRNLKESVREQTQAPTPVTLDDLDLAPQLEHDEELVCSHYCKFEAK